MNTQANETATNYVWTTDKLNNSGDCAVAICLTRSEQLFCAAWNYGTQSGYLGRWSPTTSKFINLGGTFNNSISQMCTDNLGNIYMVGDTGVSGNYVIKIYNAPNNKWSEADNGYKFPINFICCDTNNNVYVTGNFQNAGGNFCVMQYNAGTNAWLDYSGTVIGGAVIDMCMDASNNLYALWADSTNKKYLSCWNGKAWNTFNSTNFDDETSAITCDNSGNVYFNNSKTIMSCAVATQTYTDLSATIPNYGPGTTAQSLVYIDGKLYFAGYGFNTPTTISAFVQVHAGTAWQNITPSGINSGQDASIFGLAGYQGKSNNVLLASNQNAVYKGSKLIS